MKWREWLLFNHNLVDNLRSPLSRVNPIHIIQGYLENKFPGFYIGIIGEREYGNTYKVEGRYSCRYGDGFGRFERELFNRAFTFRINMWRYYQESHLNPDQLIYDILTNVVLHLHTDIMSKDVGREYLENYNISLRELTARNYERQYREYRGYDSFSFCLSSERLRPLESPFEIPPSTSLHDIPAEEREIFLNAFHFFEESQSSRARIREYIEADINYANAYGAAAYDFEEFQNISQWGVTKEGNEKAEKLLLSFLTDEQKEQYQKDRTFICYGAKTKIKYRVLPKIQINIEVYKGDDEVDHRLCITPNNMTPIADQQLAIKLMLEDNEDDLLEIAIKHDYFQPFPNVTSQSS